MDQLVQQETLSEAQLLRRDKIALLKDAIANQEDAVFGDSDLCPLTHTFADGQYIREIFIPKGATVVGKIHRHRHANFILKGEVVVYTEQEGLLHIKAPTYFVNSLGTERAVHAIEDTTWITVHCTDKTNLAEIENEVIVESFEKLLEEQKSDKRLLENIL